MSNLLRDSALSKITASRGVTGNTWSLHNFASWPSGRIGARFLNGESRSEQESHPRSISSASRGAMVMTLDARGASRRTRDPEIDPSSFFESPIRMDDVPR